MIYYTEYPTGQFVACSDSIALEKSTAKFIYRESDTADGLPFVIIRDIVKNGPVAQSRA